MGVERGYRYWSINNVGFSDDGGANAGVEDDALLKARTDFKVACELLIAERPKASYCDLDRGSMMSKIMWIEKKSKVQFERARAKTKQDAEEIENSHGKKLVLECDCKGKKERMKCEEEHENDNIRVRNEC